MTLRICGFVSTCLFLAATVALAQTAGSFAATGSMITPRWGQTATLLPSGKVLIAGGTLPQSASALASAELYDPTTGAFSATGDMITPRAFHMAALLPNGKVLIAGGGTRTGTSLVATAELYDPSTETFSVTGDMVEAGRGAAILLADGRVLIAHDVLGPSYAPAELYDPAGGTFSATGNQLVYWGGSHKASLLADGRILLAICCTAEQLYDPAAGTFSLTGAMAGIYEDGFAMAGLPDGAVLVTGGYSEEGNGYSAAAALYNPATRIFNATGNIAQGRCFHTATPLGDGTVLIAGGQNPSNNMSPYGVLSSAEVYDPATSTFSATGGLAFDRTAHTATLLLDGTVLVAGGEWSAGSTEIYRPAVTVPAPVLFSLSGDGRRQGAIWHADTEEVASAGSPAAVGDVLSMYTTSLVPGGVIPPQVSIGGRLGEILYFGAAPGYPGYYQVNFRVPNGVMPGSAVPVHLIYFGRWSNEVTVAVR
jgi:hypothetical protein